MAKDRPPKTPPEMLERMIAFGARLFSVPKDAIADDQAKRKHQAASKPQNKKS